MARNITGAMATAAAQALGITVLLATELDFASGPKRIHSGLGDIGWDGKTFEGVGELGNVTEAEESAEIKDTALDLSLSGIINSFENMTIALTEDYRGRRGTLYLMFLDEAGDLILDPVIIYEGRMDNMVITQGDTLTVTVRLLSVFADWNRARIQRYTNENLQVRHPGDRFAEFVPQMVEKEIKWG